MLFNKNATRAGMIPWRKSLTGEIEMLFMIPSDPAYGGPKPQIAKGVIDPGEDPATTAYREAREELGITDRSIAVKSMRYVGMFLFTKQKYQVHLFTIQVLDSNKLIAPHYETGEIMWLTFDQFIARGRKDQHQAVRETYETLLPFDEKQGTIHTSLTKLGQ